MPRLAIVISAVGSVESMEGTLASVLEHRPADCEILVALSQPYSDPYELHDEVRFIDCTKYSSPTRRIHQALAATKAPFVHLLSSGCEVTEGWADEALSRFGDRRVASVVPLVMDTHQRDRVFAAGVGYRRAGKRCLVGQGNRQLEPEILARVVGACGFAAFYRKAALDLVGGLSGQLGVQQADVDLALCLGKAGFAAALEPQSCVYASREAEVAQSAFRQALCDERLFWRNLPSGGQGKAILAHAALVAAELVSSLPGPRTLARLAARFCACFQIASFARHRRGLAQLSQRAIRPKSTHERLRVDRSHDAQAPAAVDARVRSR